MNGHLAAGLLLGIALTKPTLAGPFFLALLVRRKWRVVLMAAAYVALASAITWALTQTPPWEMLRQMSATSGLFFNIGYGPTQWVIYLGFSATVATCIVAPTVALAGMGLCYRLRNADLLATFAISSLVARLWTYHLAYDDAIMIFAIAYFAREFMRRADRWSLTALILLCLSIWPPARPGEPAAVAAFNMIIWFACAAIIAKLELPKSPATSPESHGNFKYS